MNAVAGEIAIDQSGASRLVKNVVDAGYLTLSANPSDGRRREVAVTPHGRAALWQAHAWQEQVFDELTAVIGASTVVSVLRQAKSNV